MGRVRQDREIGKEPSTPVALEGGRQKVECSGGLNGADDSGDDTCAIDRLTGWAGVARGKGQGVYKRVRSSAVSYAAHGLLERAY